MNRTKRDSPSIRTTGMNRRSFLGAGAAASAGLLATVSAVAAQAPADPPASAKDAPPAGAPRAKFKLKYAPTFGMFAAHAGKDLVAQLRFMAEAGFSALLDGGFLGR